MIAEPSSTRAFLLSKSLGIFMSRRLFWVMTVSRPRSQAVFSMILQARSMMGIGMERRIGLRPTASAAVL